MVEAPADDIVDDDDADDDPSKLRHSSSGDIGTLNESSSSLKLNSGKTSC